jgi:hypothetical protein
MDTPIYAMRNKPQSEQMAHASKYPQGYFNDKPCKECGTSFKPTAPSKLYYSQACADTGFVSRYLERKYGISYSTYLEMKEAQQNLCLICKGEGFIWIRKDTSLS